MSVNLVVVPIEKPEAVNLILGQAHFIKTVEDLHEALVTAVPGAAFGLAFCESSGPCLVRWSGTDEELIELARRNALAIGAGHSFLVLLRNCYPINVLPAIRALAEVCGVYCATANPVEVIVAETSASPTARARRASKGRARSPTERRCSASSATSSERHSISYVTCSVAETVASPGSIGVGVTRASAAMAASKRRGETMGALDVVAETTPFSRTPRPFAALSAWARASAPAFSSAPRSSSARFESENWRLPTRFAPAPIAASMRAPTLSIRRLSICTSLRAT